MPAALFCHVDPARDDDRHRLRADHLAYIAAHRVKILAGGPTLTATSTPETMVILLDLDPSEAEAFIHAEPYTANGVFSSVEVKPWARVLPEPHPGALDESLSAERARHVGGDRASTPADGPAEKGKVIADKREVEHLVAELRSARDHGDEPGAARLQAELEAVAKRNRDIADTISAMLATL